MSRVKKNGFTLIELIAVIIILGMLGLLVIPTITNVIQGQEESLYQSQITKIEQECQNWAYKNLDILPKSEEEQATITILELKKSGYLPLDLRNPKTGELFPNDMQIVITFSKNQYHAKVNVDTGTTVDNTVNELSPVMVLNGNVLEYLEMGSAYEEKGVSAKDHSGNIITNIAVQYLDNGVEIANINSNTMKVYTVVYTAKSTTNGQEYTSHVVRTVIVRDTIAPELIIPENVTITLSEANNFDLMNGVSYQDNSKETLNVQVSGFEATVGKKKVSYTVCDSSNNCTTKNRLVTVTE